MVIRQKRFNQKKAAAGDLQGTLPWVPAKMGKKLYEVKWREI